MFSGGLEIEHWLEMRLKKLESSLLHSSLQYLKNIEICHFSGHCKVSWEIFEPSPFITNIRESWDEWV